MGDEVIKTYKDTMPKAVEWVHQYDPENEFAFWAELYKPSRTAGRGTSLLTDELCGGYGSRLCIVEAADDKSLERLEDDVDLLTNSSRAEVQAHAAKAQALIERNRKKRERQ